MNPSLEEPLVKRDATFSAESGVATLSLNRPAQFNALSGALLDALQAELDAITNDQRVRVVILKGSGRAFCAGHDLREMQAHSGEPQWHQHLFEQCSKVMLTLAEMPQPVIAEVHGIATAAGCQLVAACDLAFAGRSARFATSGVNLGLFCSTPAVALTRNIAAKHAAEMLFTGEFIDAETAARWGLVNRCVDDGALSECVSTAASAIATKSFAALRSGKALLRAQRGLTLADAYRIAGDNMACDMQSADAQAGIHAFLSKQPTPSWTHQ
jgi:enoyl-CoA hydratase/carnithine racemase